MYPSPWCWSGLAWLLISPMATFLCLVSREAEYGVQEVGRGERILGVVPHSLVSPHLGKHCSFLQISYSWREMGLLCLGTD